MDLMIISVFILVIFTLVYPSIISLYILGCTFNALITKLATQWYL